MHAQPIALLLHRRLPAVVFAVGCAFAFASTSAAQAAAPAGKKHPSLVDPAKTKCNACHEDVTKKSVQHPPALDDCRTCHEFVKKDGLTQVSLTAALPGLCVTCHDGLAKAAGGTLAAPHAPVMDSCANCHNPHASANAHLLNSPPQELCASCHAADDVNKKHPLAVSQSDCLSCHLPHGSAQKGMLAGAVVHPPFAEKTCDACHRKGLGTRARTRLTGGALCFSCHSDLEAKFSKGSVHTAVRNGLCTSCHNPHLAGEKKLLKAKGSELCFGCHAAIKARTTGPGAHAAVKDGCETCHDPHQSDVPKQLSAKLPDLCLTCHDATDQKLAKKHLGADMRKTQCTACHDPHGSKDKPLLATGSVHPPFAEKSCDSCHEGSASKLVENGTRKLCFACHADIEENIKKAKVPHAALDGAECTECHTPHASAQKKLLKAPTAALCITCHDDKGMGKDEVAHGIIDWVGCQACHLPHGGDAPKLLRESGAKLCLSCHEQKNVRIEEGKPTVTLLGRFEVSAEKAKTLAYVRLSPDGQRNHPVTGHRVAGKPTEQELARGGSIFKGELTCLVCHDPHKSRSPRLFRTMKDGSVRECTTCHPK